MKSFGLMTPPKNPKIKSGPMFGTGSLLAAHIGRRKAKVIFTVPFSLKEVVEGESKPWSTIVGKGVDVWRQAICKDTIMIPQITGYKISTKFQPGFLDQKKPMIFIEFTGRISHQYDPAGRC